MRLEMLGQLPDPFGEDRDLHLRASRVRIVRAIRGDDVNLLCRCQHSGYVLLILYALGTSLSVQPKEYHVTLA